MRLAFSTYWLRSRQGGDQRAPGAFAITCLGALIRKLSIEVQSSRFARPRKATERRVRAIRDAAGSAHSFGGTAAFMAPRLALLPDADVGVVVLLNLANNDRTSVTGRRVLEALAPPPAAVGYQPSAEELDRVAGLYRPLDFLDPELWYLGYLVALEIERRGDTLVQSSQITGESTLLPIGPNRFRILGSMFDDSTVLFDGDSMYMGFVNARRISAWQSPTALVVYTVLLALTLASLLGWGAWRAVRRPRRPQGA